MTTESLFEEPVGKFIVTLDTSKASNVWKYFGTLVYNEQGKRRSVNNQYFCKACLDKAIATDEEAPFNKYAGYTCNAWILIFSVFLDTRLNIMPGPSPLLTLPHI